MIWTNKISDLRANAETIFCRHASFSTDTPRRRQWCATETGILVTILGIGARLLVLVGSIRPNRREAASQGSSGTGSGQFAMLRGMNGALLFGSF